MIASQAAAHIFDTSEFEVSWDGSMAWAKRNHSKVAIDHAGHDLISLPADDPARQTAIAIVDNWRSCHAYPLWAIKKTLKNRAKGIAVSATVVQRLKRRTSIEIKLMQNSNMKLSQMQDLGGCRAVMPSIRSVKSLVHVYKTEQKKSGRAVDRSHCEDFDAFDYIKCPKEDGYRGVHLIMRFRSASKDLDIYNGQRIEIQIRSQLQHVWATAVETAQLFTGQALKSRIKDAHVDWLRFFALASGAFAFKEKLPPVPGLPQDLNGTVDELRDVMNRIGIIAKLRQWNNSLNLIDQKASATARMFLLKLNPKDGKLNIFQFEKYNVETAHIMYADFEREAESNPDLNVVLVSADDFAGLRKAYPNYYLDTAGFLAAVQKALQKS